MTLDFANQRKNMEELLNYIQQKQTNANVAQPETVINQEMNLAVQPEIASDALTEEPALNTEQVSNDAQQVIDTTAPVPGEVPVVEPVQENQELAVAAVEPSLPDAFAQVAQAPEATPAVAPVEAPAEIPVTEAIPVVDPQPIETAQVVEPAPVVETQPIPAQMLDTSASNLAGETMPVAETAEMNSPANVAQPILDTPTVTPVQPEVDTNPITVETVEQPVAPVETTQVAEPIPGPVMETPAVETQAIDPTSVVAQPVEASPVVEPQPAMVSESAPAVAPEGVLQVSEIASPTPQPEVVVPAPAEQPVSQDAVIPSEGLNNDIPDITPIPDITLPDVTMPSNEPETYVATGSTPVAGIPDVTPVQEATPVVMPNGVTPDVANNPDLVVGPEAFGGPTM